MLASLQVTTYEMIVFGLASKYFVPMLMNKTTIDGLELNAVYFYIGFALRGG